MLDRRTNDSVRQSSRPNSFTRQQASWWGSQSPTLRSTGELLCNVVWHAAILCHHRDQAVRALPDSCDVSALFDSGFSGFHDKSRRLFGATTRLFYIFHDNVVAGPILWSHQAPYVTAVAVVEFDTR